MVTIVSTTVAIVISFCVVEVLAVDEICATPNNGSPIDNCCDLRKFAPLAFSEIPATVNKPKVYKLKNFCDKNCTTVIINGYCDTLTDGGGWLVVQRRTNGSENFHRNWNDYEIGFGSLTGELWYGLRALHCLTQHGKWELRIDFTFSNGTKSFMHYNHFRVGPATRNYRLSISGFTGITPTDPFSAHNINGRPFSTYDKDNSYSNCAVTGHGSTTPGGWWFRSCFAINLNYNYGGPRGFIHLARKWYTPTSTEMKIRPVNCKI